MRGYQPLAQLAMKRKKQTHLALLAMVRADRPETAVDDHKGTAVAVRGALDSCDSWKGVG